MDSRNSIQDLLQSWDGKTEGEAIFRIVSDLYPICRSITGDGLRQSLRYLAQIVPMELREVPTGTRVLDWEVPKEWNIRDAYIKDARGVRIVDFQKSNLHVLNYSTPVRRRMRLPELREHLFSLPEHPDWIPYRTSYYREAWGFCLGHRQLEALADQEYEVCIDSTLEPGHLTYGEYLVHGQTEEEVLVSCHSCHPSLCNDNLSGMAVSTRLAARLTGLGLRYSYRFLWIPGTIGAICWLAANEAQVHRIRHGWVLSCLGDSGPFTYKRSRRGNAEVDRISAHVLRHSGESHRVVDFTPYGYDERQYCSPGFNLPVGCLMRTPHGQYPEYHTSADNLELVKTPAQEESLRMLLDFVQALEGNRTYLNLCPKGEPQLGRRGLYRAVGGIKDSPVTEQAMLWVLNYSDGRHSLLDIADRACMPLTVMSVAAEVLAASQIVQETNAVGEVGL